MQYFGGKSKIKKHIVNHLEGIRNGRTYIEPFVGGASIVSGMSGDRRAYDKHPYLIAMYNALQSGWIPPTSITEEEYKKIKEEKSPDYLTGFVGFSCSFSGKWFGGYARNSRGDDYCLNSHNSLQRKMESMQDVVFECLDYRDLNPKDSLIYCDPPYKETTQYGFVGSFNSDEFWGIMREWSQDNTVVVSEYNAPDDFECVWEHKTKTEIRNKKNEREDRVERLFTYR